MTPSGSTFNASVAENLLFGTPIGPVFDFEALADNTYVSEVLTKVGLIEDLVAAGKHVPKPWSIFLALPADHEFFEQFSFISASDLPEFGAILGRIGEAGTMALAKEDRVKLLSLPFKLIPARHRLDVVDESMQQRLLEARRVFRADLPPKARQQIEFFDPQLYNAAASVQDNILFGKIAYGESDAPVGFYDCRGGDRRLVAAPDRHRCRARLQRRDGRLALVVGPTAESRNRPRCAQAPGPADPQRGNLCSRRARAVEGKQRAEGRIRRSRDNLGAASGEPRAKFRPHPCAEQRKAGRAGVSNSKETDR
jgi:hypothetical protein